MARKYSSLRDAEKQKALETMSGEKFDKLQSEGDVDLDDEQTPTPSAPPEEKEKEGKKEFRTLRGILQERHRQAGSIR